MRETQYQKLHVKAIDEQFTFLDHVILNKSQYLNIFNLFSLSECIMTHPFLSKTLKLGCNKSHFNFRNIELMNLPVLICCRHWHSVALLSHWIWSLIWIYICMLHLWSGSEWHLLRCSGDYNRCCEKEKKKLIKSVHDYDHNECVRLN